MNSKINKQKDENSGLHPLNKHHASYNFTELVEVCPELKSFVIINKFKIETIDFTNADAVKMLNKALLQKFYGITHWDIPKNYLCPPIPGRADYINYIADLLAESIQHLSETYPHIIQIPDEKVLKIEGEHPEFTVITNKNSYKTKTIVIGIGSANTFAIEGLTQFVEPHQKALPEKQRIQLKNTDHKVAEGIYVIGTLAGWRNQVAIAAGSGAAVATDILTLWNSGVQTHAHDSIR